jgi:hypothetical protein
VSYHESEALSRLQSVPAIRPENNSSFYEHFIFTGIKPTPSTTLCLSNYFWFLILLDLIGVFTAVGNERELERNGTMTKLNVIEFEAGG